MTSKKILIVEDDEHISRLVDYNLTKAGFKCEVYKKGEDALVALKKRVFDLVILDIMLPEMDGFEICKHIRQDTESAHIPILMLTARSEEIDKVLGFELGADDYVVKPFSPRELVLRVKAILKRKDPTEEANQIITVEKLTIDITAHRILLDKKEIELTPMEFKLLVILIKRRGRVQSRDVLLDDVWDIAADVTTRTIDTHIKRLRQKMGKMGKYIETVRGIGYRFKPEDK